MIGVLFVCLGNICRSPMAAGVFRDLVRRQSLDEHVRVDSAGVGSWHAGESPDRRARVAVRSRGVDISDLRARRITVADFDAFDYILAMDCQNRDDLIRFAPPTHRDRVQLFLDFAPHADVRGIADPYYGDETAFERVLDLIDVSGAGLLAHIRETRLGL